MRIAVFHNLPSGGAKRTLSEAASRLACRHQVDGFTLSSADHSFADVRAVLTSHTEIGFDPIRLRDSPWGRVNPLLRSVDLGRLQVLSRRIAARIDQGGYDVVLAHPCRFEQAPSVLSYLSRTPSVYYCHEPPRLLYESTPPRPTDDSAIWRRRLLNVIDPLPRTYRSLLRAVDRRNVRRAGMVLVNSEFTAGSVSSIYGVTASVSYHGVDATRFRPLALPKRHIVLSVGSLTPLKGFDFLVRAMARYPGSDRPTLVIASNFQNPPERMYLEELAREHRVALELAGCVDDEQLVRLYNEAKAVAYAPVREPFGLVPLEAMACGTPVVGVAEGGVPESIVDGQTGLLAERDPARFAEAIRRVIEDAEWTTRSRERGRAHVLRHWTWERAVARLEERLAECQRAPRIPQRLS